jgi:hypothetical protein
MNPVLTRAAAALLLAFGALSSAQAAGHYVPGVEGIQAASVPPPGTYYLGYMVNYSVDSFRAPGSSSDLPGSNTATINALANRVVWISRTKVLGADFGMETIVPVMRKSLTLNAAAISESKSGVGDIYLGPLVLGWHGPSWDAVAAAGVWVDSGSDSTPASAGNGYQSTMLTAGATRYFDDAKSLSGSALMRYEINGKTSSGFKPGQQVSLEWGFGKTVGPVQLGLVGYDQWQVSDDSGTGATSSRSARHAVGGEVVYPLMSSGVILKAALYKEYSAKAGTGAEPKGTLLRFTVVKVF